jgi:predicted TIM-barrel fold metal-dependent hydrolase
MLFIDFHVHIGELGGIWAEIHGKIEHSPEIWIKRMNKIGIDKAVVFPFVSGLLTHEDFKNANNYILQAIKKYPEKLIGFCTITPMHGKWALTELQRCVENGIKGIKLYPPGHGFYPIDGAFMDPIMEFVAKNDLIILTHSDFNTKICTPFHVVNLAERFPEVTIVMAHFGEDPDVCHWVPDIVKKVKNIVLDTSCTPDIPESIFSRPINIIGPERIVFGSDAPTLSPEVNLKKLEIAEEIYNIPKEVKKKILGENAARILHL